MPSKRIDGSKYFYWRQRYISTGNLRAFDLMTRHYAAMPTKPVHKQDERTVFEKFAARAGVGVFEEEWPDILTWAKIKQDMKRGINA